MFRLRFCRFHWGSGTPKLSDFFLCRYCLSWEKASFLLLGVKFVKPPSNEGLRTKLDPGPDIPKIAWPCIGIGEDTKMLQPTNHVGAQFATVANRWIRGCERCKHPCWLMIIAQLVLLWIIMLFLMVDYHTSWAENPVLNQPVLWNFSGFWALLSMWASQRYSGLQSNGLLSITFNN